MAALICCFLKLATFLLAFLVFLEIDGIIQVGGTGPQHVTCGSVIKLLNTAYKVRLHSHDVKYGSGSGQQSVTGTELKEDVNSHWTIKGTSRNSCPRGQPIKCGTTVRLEHLSTHKNLHSHHFSSPLSGSQEISAFGDGGEGDSGDHWLVVCTDDVWTRDEEVMLKHVDTDAYLAASGHTYGRPIHGQMEVVGLTSPDHTANWQVAEGVFLHPPSASSNSYRGQYNSKVHPDHNEL